MQITRKNGATGLLLVLLTGLLFHVITSVHLQRYYADHLPHYDSIGSYTVMFGVVDAGRAQGWAAAFHQAATFNQSWLQAGYAAAAWPWLAKTPAAMQGYNSLCVLVALISIYRAGRCGGLSMARSYAAALGVFLPDVLYEVQGGLADLQRDSGYLMLLTGAMFSWLALAWRPHWAAGVWFGLTAALVVLCRGTALPFFIAVAGPLIGWGLWCAWREQRLAAVARALGIGVAVFSAAAGYYMVVALWPELGRYQNPFAAFQFGDSAWAAVRAHWSKPLELAIGQCFKANSLQVVGRVISFWAAISTLVVVGALGLAGVVRVSWASVRGRHNRDVLIAGAWALLAVSAVLFFVVKLRELSFPDNKHPFYPTLIWFFALWFVAVQVPRPGLRWAEGSPVARWVLVGMMGIAIGAVGIIRGRAKVYYPGNRDEIAAVRQLAAQFRTDSGPAAVLAFPWFEGISYDVLRYYTAQEGARLPRPFYYEYGGYTQDFAVSAPAGTNVPDMMRSLAEQLEARADIIIFNLRTDAYEIPNAPVVFLRAGGQVVRRLTASPRFTQVHEFTFRGDPFVVLRRQQAPGGHAGIVSPAPRR